MCGRAEDLFTPKAVAALTQLFGPSGWRALDRTEIRPTDQLRVVRPGAEGYDALLARWGLIPERMTEGDAKKYAMFNARIETLESSRAFAQAFRSRRAVIPISCFFEFIWTFRARSADPLLVRPV